MFDATIHLGDVLMIATAITGAIATYFKWNKRVDERHLENGHRFSTLEGKIGILDKKIDENTNTTNGINNRVIELNAKMREHVATDDVIQKEILRRLDTIDGTKR